MTTSAVLAVIIFIVAVIMLIWKPVHPILIGAGIPISLALFGVMDASAAFADFANTTVVFFMSLLVVGAAVFKTGLADYIGEKLIGFFGGSDKSIMLGSGIVAISMSAFLNDTGTTGCLIPIVGSMSKKAGIPLSKTLMSLAFFASLGGTLTLIGTTPHIVANGLLIDAGFAGFSFFEFAYIGIPLSIAGLLYMYFIGMRIVPEKKISESEVPALAIRNNKKMVLVACIFIFIVYCMASGLLPMHLAAALGALSVVLTGCISVEEALKSFSVTTMFLVAGIFPLSTALVKTGAAKYAIDYISQYLMGLPPVITYGAIAAATIFFTQFLMNTSLTAILVPMGIMIAQSANIDPRGAVMAIAMAASAAFCTPFGTGPNLLVWELGKYEVRDYFRIGFPLTIIFWLITTVFCVLLY